MPTFFRKGPYRFFCYAGDRDEPLHVHVEHGEKVAKFWLDPVRLQGSTGFSRGEIGKIHRVLVENRQVLMEAWHGYFGR